MDIAPKSEKPKTPLEELETLVAFKDSIQFVVLKRIARRWIEFFKAKSYELDPSDPNLALKHSKYLEQAEGMKMLIKTVEDAASERKRLEDLEP